MNRRGSKHAGAALLGVGCALAHLPARGAVCNDRALDQGAPARIGPGPAGFGSLPEACAGTEVSLQGDAALLVAADDFYGSVSASVALRARYAVSQHFWLSLWAPGLDYRYVANATVTADSLDLGASALSAHVALPIGRRAQLAPYLRVLVPTETVFVNGTRYGVEHGFALTYRATPELELVGGATFPALFTDTAGHVQARYEPGLGAEAVYTPWRFVSLVGGATARLRFGDDRAFESFDPTLAFRFFALRGLRIELAARAPLFGADRTDAAVALGMGWIFGRLP